MHLLRVEEVLPMVNRRVPQQEVNKPCGLHDGDDRDGDGGGDDGDEDEAKGKELGPGY